MCLLSLFEQPDNLNKGVATTIGVAGGARQQASYLVEPEPHTNAMIRSRRTLFLPILK